MTGNAIATGDREHLVPNQDVHDRVAASRARARREELGLSRETLAALSGLNRSNLVRWELNGIPRYLLGSEQRAWERALNVPSGWLFKAEEKEAPGNSYFEAGQRARERRVVLGITRRAVAASVGISVEILARWERVGAPTRIKEAQVAAWEQALKVEPGWLFGKTCSAVTTTEGQRRVASAASDAISAIIEIAARVAAVRFEKIAPGEVRDERERVSAKIFAQRYGADTSGKVLLAEIAEQHGIVESRVSQILKSLHTTARGLNIEVAVFERIHEQAQSHLPCALHELEKSLRPLLGDGLSLENANRFCTEVLGKPLFAIAKRRVNGNAKSMAASPDAGDSIADISVHDTAIADMARAMIRATGVAHMGLLKTYAAEQGWATEVITKVPVVLEQTMGFEWLEAPTAGKPQWFWLRGYATEKNLILDATRRVLAVATGLVALDEIEGAIGRLRTMRTSRAVFSPMFDIQPPTRVVRALLQQQPWLSVLGPEAGIRSLQKIDVLEALPPSEQAIYGVLREVGGVATRAWLFSQLVKSGGMDETSFRDAILWAPSLTRPYRGVYGLRGVQPDPDVLAKALQDSSVRTSSVLPVEVDTQAGRVMFHQVVNDWHLRGGWVTLPAGLVAHVPQKRYTVHPDGGEVEICQSERAATIIKGLSRVLRTRGLGVACVIRLTFDLPANRLFVDLVPQSECTVSALQ